VYALRSEDEHLVFPALLLDSLEQAVIATDLKGNILYWNRFAEKLHGWRAVEVLGKSLLDVKPADQSADEAREVLERVLRGESWSGEITLRRKDGTSFPALVTASPLYDAEARVIGVASACHDISQRRAAERQSEMVLAEQAHRLKNMLAVVQSLANQTARQTSSTDDFMASFTSRLSAVAAANDLLMNRGGEATALEELAHATLGPLLDPKRMRLQGPNVTLQRRMILPFSMLLHELYTNAAKYGALSAPAGMIDIEWQRDDIEGQSWLAFEWRESKGPIVEQPRKKGFGSVLIERAIARELNAHVVLDFAPAGVSCRLRTRL
jgi:PAS domain S-box-containing protein